MFNSKTKKLAMDSMLAAMCAVLGYLSLDFGNLKITFESVPILLGALLLGPIDGMAIGGVGTLLYQLVRYGVSLTTPLWILPYVRCGLVVGAGAARQGFHPGRRESTVLIVSGELLITLLNTVTLYIDSKLYGYYYPGLILAPLALRLAICVGKSAVFSAVLPQLAGSVGRALSPRKSR